MKVLYLACAISSSVDTSTNRLSLFHLLEEMSAPAFPIKLQTFCVAILFEREPDDEISEPYVISIELDGRLLLSVPSRADFSRTARARRVTTINELSLPAPGALTVSILRKSVALASWPVLVRQDRRHGSVRATPQDQPKNAPPPKRSVN